MKAFYKIVRILQTFSSLRLPPGFPIVPPGQKKQIWHLWGQVKIAAKLWFIRLRKYVIFFFILFKKQIYKI